jgi:dethiobiotin synthetase
MKGIFVTSTDTGAGKTVVTGLLARYLSEKGIRAITQKWIQTGKEQDIDMHLNLMNRKKQDFRGFLFDMVPYKFRLPASPHLAAKHERRRIDKDTIFRSFLRLFSDFDFVVAEGTGGALVPYSGKNLLIDIARELKMPVLIVAENRLGVINHTMLTIEAIKRRNMKMAGIVFNAPAARVSKVILKDNPEVIKRLSGEKILGCLPRLQDRER